MLHQNVLDVETQEHAMICIKERFNDANTWSWTNTLSITIHIELNSNERIQSYIRIVVIPLTFETLNLKNPLQ